MNTSYSALDTFSSCPLKYKFQEIDRIKKPTSPEAVFGTLIHSTMKYIHDGGFVFPTLKEALQFFSTNWNAEIFNNETEERMAFAQGIKIIQDYYQKNDPARTQIVDLESRFTIEIKDAGQTHLVSGFIDRIDKTDNGFEIIDYKTNRKLPGQNMVDDNLQLLIYLLAFIKKYPDQAPNIRNIKLSLYFLKHGIKLSTTKSSDQIEQGKLIILDLIHDIEKSDFPPKVTPLCGWCGFQKYCPMWKHKFKEAPAVLESEEKEKIIEEYIDLADKLKNGRKRLMELQSVILEIMKNEGADRLFSQGKIISRGHRQTYKYDEQKLKQILNEMGLWENVLKLDNTRLKKAMETLPLDIKKQIESAKELDKESWSLSVKKDKIDTELEEE